MKFQPVVGAGPKLLRKWEVTTHSARQCVLLNSLAALACIL